MHRPTWKTVIKILLALCLGATAALAAAAEAPPQMGGHLRVACPNAPSSRGPALDPRLRDLAGSRVAAPSRS